VRSWVRKDNFNKIDIFIAGQPQLEIAFGDHILLEAFCLPGKKFRPGDLP
jgi:hypothetical protein